MRRIDWRRNSGAAAVPILGAALLFLLLVGALGLAESARAAAMRTRAVRALAAAVESAIQAGVTDQGAATRAFQRVLKANLAPLPYTAKLTVRGRTVTGRLEMPYRMQYLTAFRSEARLVVVQSASAPERKAKP